MFGLSIGIYPRRFLATLALIATAAFVWVIAQHSISADSVPFEETTPGRAQAAITLDERGRTTVNGQRTASIVEERPTTQRLVYIATDAQGRYLDQLTVTITLPKPLTEAELSLRSIGAYGIGDSRSRLANPTQISYEVMNVSPQAIYTIEVDLPPHYFQLPVTQRIGPFLTSVPFAAWLAVGLTFPLIALVVLAFLVRSTTTEWRHALNSHETAETPPSELAPALAGVLIAGKMNPRMLAATILDLAEREYLVISNHDNAFTFGRRRARGQQVFGSSLAAFEQKLLEKLFAPSAVRATRDEIDVQLGRQLFSRKVAEIYLDVYDTLTHDGYFHDNPSVVYQRYRTIGIGLFFAALFGFILTLVFMPGPKFSLVSWVGMMVASGLIMRGVPFLPRRTAKGITALKAWLAFRTWLALPKPLAGDDAPLTYRRYLPYAVAFGVEVEWTRRVSGSIVQPPDWLITHADYLKIDDFAGQVFPIVGYVATNLAAVRDPNS